MMHYGFGMGGMMGIGWLFQLIILALFFMVIWWVLKDTSCFGYKYSKDESALDILKKRLAAGDITSKEFEKLKKEIE